MKAVVVREHGGPGKLNIEEVAEPELTEQSGPWLRDLDAALWDLVPPETEITRVAALPRRWWALTGGDAPDAGRAARRGDRAFRSASP